MERAKPRQIAAKKAEVIPRPPKGWLTVFGLSKQLSLDRKAINTALKHFQPLEDGTNEEFQGHLRRYSDGGKRVYTYISPQLSLAVKTWLESIPQAHEGWKTLGDLVRELGAKNWNPVRRILDEIRPTEDLNQEFEGHFQMMRGSSGIFEYYSPQVIEILRQKYNEIPPVPDGWTTLATLAKKIGFGRKPMQKIIDSLREKEEFEMDFGFFRCPGKPTTYFSPKVAEKIQEIAESTPAAPEGWTLLLPLAKKLGISDLTLKKIVEEFRTADDGTNEDFEEDFKMFRAKSGVYEHISPRLVDLITERVERLPTVNDSWISVAQLAKYLHLDKKTLIRFIEDWVTERNEDETTLENPIRQFRAVGIYGFADYFPKDFIKTITAFVEQKTAPDSWMSMENLLHKLGRPSNPQKIKNLLNSLRSGFPEEFGVFRHKKGRKTEFFSPQIAQLIEEKVTKSSAKANDWIQQLLKTKN